MAKRKTTQKPPQTCNCLKQVNEQLREKFRATLKQSLAIDFTSKQAGIAGPFLAVEWVDGPVRGKKLPIVECAFCPFCGKEKS